MEKISSKKVNIGNSKHNTATTKGRLISESDLAMAF